MNAAPYVVGEFIKVTQAEHAGRWGKVAAVIDYRDTPNAEPPAPEGVDVVVWCDLKIARGRALVSSPAEPVPFEPYELRLLFDEMGTFVGPDTILKTAQETFA